MDQADSYHSIPTLIAAVGSQLSAEFPATKDISELCNQLVRIKFIELMVALGLATGFGKAGHL